MSQYRKILLIADPEMRSTTALSRAALLAQLSGAELHVSMFVHESSIIALGAVSQEVMELARQNCLLRREEWLRQRKEELLGVVGRVETDLSWGGPLHEKIVHKVLEFKPDIVVKDVAAEPGLKRLLFTPLDWQLLRLCPAPLLLVHPEARQAPRRVIAAVDPLRALHETNGLHDHVVKAALDLALQCDASVHLVHAFEGLMPMQPGEVFTHSMQTVIDNIRNLHRSGFDEYAQRYSVPPERMHFIEGPAALVIPGFATDHRADVVVVGTIHRTGLDRVIMGSTAERILDAVHCDVLAVKPAGFETDLKSYLRPATWLAPAPAVAARKAG